MSGSPMGEDVRGARPDPTGSPTLRRSVLYVPGSNERALAKAGTLPADTVVLDLEDAVAPSRKDRARELVAGILEGSRLQDHEVVVRVNAPDGPWFVDDIRAIAPLGPDGVLVPKIDGPQDVRRLEQALASADAPGATRLWAMLETPRAVLDAPAVATASERLAALVVGTNDLTEALRAGQVPGRTPLLASLSWCVLAARASGVAVVDGAFGDLEDEKGLFAECRQARELGFDGKSLIHPCQIRPCHRAFAPSGEEVRHAREVIRAFEGAAAAGHGVTRVQGQMVERLHVDRARRILAAAAASRG